MKTILTFSGIFLSSWSLLAAESLTQDAPSNWRKDLSFNAEAGFNSRYMSDGVAASENPVFNPAASATFRNFTAGFWSNMNFNEPGSEGKFNEVDLNLAYEWSWNDLTVTPEYIHYFYPNTAGAKNTGELALSAAYTFWDDLMDVHTNNRFDIKENKRGYVGTFGLGASTDYTEKAECCCKR